MRKERWRIARVTHLPDNVVLLNLTPLSACFKQTNTYRVYHERKERVAVETEREREKER